VSGGQQAAAVGPASGCGPALVSVRKLSVRYTGHRRAVYAVADVSLDVPAGQTVAIVGESGSGKSTLLRAIAGLVPIASGRVEINGGMAGTMPGRAGGVQMVFQDPDLALDPRQPVWKSVAEPLAPRRLRMPDSMRKPAMALLDEVGLARDIAGRKPHELSGGQRQRVTIARAVAVRPALVLLDEPLSAQDVSLQASLLRLLTTMQREHNLAYIVVSHDVTAVARMADRVGVMYAAKLIEIGAAGQVLERPRHPYTQALIAAVPRVSASREAASQVVHGEPPDLRQPPGGCRFHPRCAFAIQRCATEEPVLNGSAEPGGHLVACHRWQEISALPRSGSALSGEAPTQPGRLAQGQP
jgi:oligopeptide/dipeptide ABC transporter ATP-binding protein